MEATVRRLDIEVDPLIERVRRSWCVECGMELEEPDEYHPSEFCVLFKTGYNPWLVILNANKHRKGENG